MDAGNRPNDCALSTLIDIKLAISNLKKGKSPGFDEIMPKMIRNVGNPLASL